VTYSELKAVIKWPAVLLALLCYLSVFASLIFLQFSVLS